MCASQPEDGTQEPPSCTTELVANSSLQGTSLMSISMIRKLGMLAQKLVLINVASGLTKL